MAQHTSGLWFVAVGENTLGERLTSVVAVDGSIITNDEPYYPAPLRRENAVLIAAAPDLRDALAEIVIRMGNGEPYCGELHDMARAALAKATGD